ncbi:hypothetical protein ABQX22_22080 [Xanthomonas sp. WHRI 1810A]|uniref:hypothetical protein n=1 Tax=Xanthomonas sp. WHRI 1810A TaxID=3161565 RepID=UPI0032E871D7
MKYSSLMSFMYDVGNGVGEFLTDEEKAVFVPLTLAEIVKAYVDESYPLDRFLLRRNIKSYIKNHLSADGLEYAYPFEYELTFPEDYFEGDLHVFLKNVLFLLEVERKARIKAFFFR